MSVLPEYVEENALEKKLAKEKERLYHQKYKKKKYKEDPVAKKKQQEASKKSNAIRWAKETPKEQELRKYKNWVIGLKRRYNITPEQLTKMIEDVNGVCSICKDPSCQSKNKSLVIDHNHKTGRVRDILGNKCNVAIGMVKEDPNILKNIVMYLFKHEMIELLESKEPDYQKIKQERTQSLLDSILISPAEAFLDKETFDLVKKFKDVVQQSKVTIDGESIDDAEKLLKSLKKYNEKEWVKNELRT